MTTFKEIRGTAIEVVSSDPSNPEGGQIWYNSSSGTLKGSQYSATWSSSGAVPVGKSVIGSGAGTQTAGLLYGGNNATGIQNTVATYNGSSWTSVTNMNIPRTSFFGGGTQTAAFAAGGVSDPGFVSSTENYNGSSWTSSGSMNSQRLYGGSARNGTQTAGLAFGGELAPPRATTGATETYNGSSWTSVSSMNTGRTSGVNGSGTQTAALAFGGFPSPTATESYNGTWTTVNSLNTGRQYLSGAGTQTATIAFGGTGTPSYTGATELWNGTAWTSNPTGLGTARAELGGFGLQSAAVAAAGTNPSYLTSTEEFNQGFSTKTLTVS
jgi:hypothetical protein